MCVCQWQCVTAHYLCQRWCWSNLSPWQGPIIPDYKSYLVSGPDIWVTQLNPLHSDWTLLTVTICGDSAHHRPDDCDLLSFTFQSHAIFCELGRTDFLFKAHYDLNFFSFSSYFLFYKIRTSVCSVCSIAKGNTPLLSRGSVLLIYLLMYLSFIHSLQAVLNCVTETWCSSADNMSKHWW